MDENGPEGAPAPWAQVRIQVSPPAQEGLANLLLELGAGGLLVQEEGLPHPCLSAYFPSDSQLPSTLQALARYLSSLAEMGLDPGPQKLEVLPWRDRGESERWKDFFKPLLLGRRLVIKPSWEWYEADPEDLVLEMDPGRAFGTGRHPSTAICLRFLERRVQGGERILDLGAGSGILAIAAAKLGARAVTALEIDPPSAKIARENVNRNGLMDQVEVREGTLSDLPREIFDLCVANLTLEEILPLLPALRALLGDRRGVLFLSGILREEMGSLRRSLEAADLSVKEWEVQREWAGLGAWKRERN
ncbi:MAG: 50S ribosomal protein L11 methyltransferase [candidate division NC10 bacterium]|nr:50S ribosomal protein L11 methyltransferase [candidate division NC10 bacterium]